MEPTAGALRGKYEVRIMKDEIKTDRLTVSRRRSLSHARIATPACNAVALRAGEALRAGR